jgi:hypothetical protein
MAEVIQFNCPVCGTLLRLPLAMASERGPCPHCQREIIAPDPLRGIGAFEIPVPPPPREIEPFRPFLESPPEATTVAEDSPPPPQLESAATRAPSPRSVLALSCLLTGAVALALGFTLGVRSKPKSAEAPPVTAPAPLPKTESPPVVSPPLPDPIPIRVKPMIDAPPAQIPPVEKKPETIQVSADAEATLRAFLEAPDWASRSAHVLFPDNVRSAMEAHSHEFPDGPTPFKSIAIKQTQIDENTGNSLSIFFVATEEFPTGIPVAVQQSADGWRVDWQAFVEFRDQLFQKFAEGPSDTNGRFHLIVSPPPPERAANTENEHFVSFLLNAPLNETPQLAFVKKGSGSFVTIQNATAAGGFFTPVLEIAKRKTADGQSYLEIVKVIATDWIPRIDS